ncbi:MAG: hypothetical protein RAO94_04930 [Candidatus Stygibacter australis]|nr:hypothetical protein [Candidatus Stygibacter australis]MDP8321677.1 hypothetical protein [Candidatus Stygibacter australis]
MKEVLKLVVLVLITVSIITGCSIGDSKTDAVDIKNLQISDDFNFETERWINVELYALFTGTFYLKDMEGNMLYKGTIDQYTGFIQKIKLPTSITEVRIEYHEVEDLYKNYEIRDNEIIHTFVPQIR